MRYGLMTRLGLFAAALAITTTVSATETNQLWSERNDYVQLDTVSATNQHPVTLSAEQLTTMLDQIYKREKNREPARYFSRDEINRISPQLVRLFAKAKPDQDIEFGTSFRQDEISLVPRMLNAGRMFIENGQLNLLIGMCAKTQDIGYQTTFGNFRKLDHGSRSKTTENIGCELLAGNNSELVNNRTDWLRLNINAAITTKNIPAFPSSMPLTFGATSIPDKTIAIVPVAANRTDEPLSLAKPALPANDVEGRLTLLKQLHDKGLITDAEYQLKRAAILKDL